MPTTTAISKFAPAITDSGMETLRERARTFSLEPKTPLQNFFTAQGIPLDTDNLVSETVDWDACTRTVVRTWATDELAQAWIQALSSVVTEPHYPGHLLSFQVDA